MGKIIKLNPKRTPRDLTIDLISDFVFNALEYKNYSHDPIREARLDLIREELKQELEQKKLNLQ